MARFARWRASRWVGVAGLRDVAPRTPPGDFFAVERWTIFAGIKKVARRGSGHRRLLIYLLFFPSQNANLAVGAPKSSFYSAPPNLAAEAPKLFFLTAKHQPRSRGAQVPPA